jgi:DNA-binding response OmpR family regulator
MITELKLKILALGPESMLRLLVNQIDPEEFRVTGCQTITEMAERLEKERFDLIILDDQIKDMEIICQAVFNLARAPVVALLRQPAPDWPNLCRLAVDGYLTDGSSRLEMAARIKAYSRRKSVSCYAPEFDGIQVN